MFGKHYALGVACGTGGIYKHLKVVGVATELFVFAVSCFVEFLTLSQELVIGEEFAFVFFSVKTYKVLNIGEVRSVFFEV